MATEKEHCPICVDGLIFPIKGTKMKWRKRSLETVTIPDEIEVPTCDKCGEQFIDHDLSKKISGAVENGL